MSQSPKADLFGWSPGDPPREGPRERVTAAPKGHAATPGMGPAGETCGSCGHLHRVRGGGNRTKTYFKCWLMQERWTGGRATDVRARDPACSKWEKNE